MSRIVFALALTAAVSTARTSAAAGDVYEDPAAPPPAVVINPPGYVPPPPVMYLPPVYSPVPQKNFRYLEKTRPKWSAIGSGLGVFALTWGLTAGISAAAGYSPGAIPIAGPILIAENINCRGQNGLGCVGMPTFWLYLVFDTILQATALGVTVYGMLAREKVFVMVPTLSPGSAGLSLGGRF